MPAFSFEKISPPAELETSGPISSPVRRGALVRFLGRLTSVRPQRSGDDVNKAKTPKHNDGKRE